MKNTFRWITGIFIFLVLIPAYLSWGPGIDGTWAGMTIHHHGVKNSWVAFFGILLICFAFWRNFQNGCLEAAHFYDALEAKRHQKIENALLILITIWLGYLKWMQSALLFTTLRDHGLFLNVLWNIAHGHGPWSSVIGRHFFSEHFSPVLYGMSFPYYFVKPVAWPLWVQTALMMGSILFLVHLGRTIFPIRPIERLLLILLFVMNHSFQDIHTADIHPIAFGIIAIIGLYLLARKAKWRWFYLCLPLAWFGIQEDVSLMVAGMSLIFLMRRQTRLHGLVVLVLSVAAFWINVEVAIRHFAAGSSGFMGRYQTMGGDMKKIVETLALKPWIPISLLFEPRHFIPLLKQFAYLGFLPLGGPVYLLGAIPGIMQHSLTDYSPQFRYEYHYSSNILPFLMLGFVAALSARKMPHRWLIPGFLFLMLYSNLRAPSYFRYRDPKMVAQAWQLGRTLTPDVKVIVQNAIGVPFSFRKDVYIFPDVKDADIIILSPTENKMPIDPETYAKELIALQQDLSWTFEKRDGLWIFKRKLNNV